MDHRDGWQKVPDNTTGDGWENAFRLQWEMFLRHVANDDDWK